MNHEENLLEPKLTGGIYKSNTVDNIVDSTLSSKHFIFSEFALRHGLMQMSFFRTCAQKCRIV
jgi:hypothetical protein